jgi:crossover junction endonuclease MUS81
LNLVESMKIDHETNSSKSNASTDETLVRLKANNVKNEVRKLNVGDFVWIARHKVEKSKELVLPYIVERKRLDDLSSSIKDGRFHEQKFRLKKSGIENVIYLIENHMKAGKVQCGLPFTTLLQAATNTQIHSKFQVKFTENNQHTILYLTVMTNFIENIFKNKAPVKFQMMDFDKFNQSVVKQRKCTVRETFIKQLLALKGLSVDIALEITNNYPTPTDLFEAYRSLSKLEGEALLSNLTVGELKRKIPKNVSKTIYCFYTCDKV